MFPFGFSLEELFYLSVFLAVAGGYRDTFVRASRSGGVFVGKAVGFIRQKREQVFASSAQRQEMQALQQQMSDALSELHSMRHHVRSSASFESSRVPSSSQPQRAIAHGALEVAPQGATVQQHSDGRRSESVNASTATQQEAHDSGSEMPASTSPVHSATQRSSTDNPLRCPADPQHSSPPATAHATSAAASSGEALSPQQRYQQLHVEDSSGHTVYIAGVPLIPVTAAAAGRAPEKRTGSLTGSHIAEEALAEQEVAHRAAQVLHGQPPKL